MNCFTARLTSESDYDDNDEELFCGVVDQNGDNIRTMTIGFCIALWLSSVTLFLVTGEKTKRVFARSLSIKRYITDNEVILAMSI